MKLIPFEDLRAQKGIPYCRDHARRLADKGMFPKPIRLGGGRRIAFVEAEIDAYIAETIAARDAEAKKDDHLKALAALGDLASGRPRVGRPLGSRMIDGKLVRAEELAMQKAE